MTFRDRINACRSVCADGAVDECARCVRTLVWAAKVLMPARLAGEALRRLARSTTLKSGWAGARAVEVADIAQLELLDKTVEPPQHLLRLATGSYGGLAAGPGDLVGVGATGGPARFLGVRCDGRALALERGVDYDLSVWVADDSPVFPEGWEPATVRCAYGVCYSVVSYRQPTWVSGGGEVSVMLGVFKLAGLEVFLAGEGVAILNYGCGVCEVREYRLSRGEALVVTDTFAVRGPFEVIYGP